MLHTRVELPLSLPTFPPISHLPPITDFPRPSLAENASVTLDKMDMGEKKTGTRKTYWQQQRAIEMEHIAAGRIRITRTRGRASGRGRGSQRTQLKKIINLYNTVAHRGIFIHICLCVSTPLQVPGLPAPQNQMKLSKRYVLHLQIKSRVKAVSFQFKTWKTQTEGHWAYTWYE